jgi:hypothetical protein
MFQSRFLFLSVLIFMLAGIPLQGNARDILFPPFFSYEAEGDNFSIQGFGPILDVSKTHTAVRPLYYRENEEDVTYFLYPLGKSTPDHSYFIPFMRSVEDRSHPHFDLFPYFSGTYDGKDYQGIFPLYGHMYHRYGFDEASFYLWPLYSRTEKSDATTYSFLWPVFSYSRDSLFRVFPLYGIESSSDSQSMFFLWPIFHHTRSSSGSMLAALPLFRYEQGPSHWNASFLWPFFTYNRDDATHHQSADFPWPIIRTATGGYEETRIFPLYWEKDEGPSYRIRSVLWPLWTTRSSKTDQSGEMEKVTSVLILNRLVVTTDTHGKTSQRLTLWPLGHFLSEEEKIAWFFPAFIPFFSDDGFNQTWGEFLTLAQGFSDEKHSQINILWKSFFWDKDINMSRWSLLFLASQKTTPEYSQWGFLGNLLNFKILRDHESPGIVP